jgi:precorrin-6B methylase 2
MPLISLAVEHLRLDELDLFRSDVFEVTGKLSRIIQLSLSSTRMLSALAPHLFNLENLHLNRVFFGGSGPLCSLLQHCPQLQTCLSLLYILLHRGPDA